MSYIGAHTSVSGGVVKGLEYIKELEGNAAQIFVGNSHSATVTKKPKWTDEQADEIKEYIKQNEMYLVIHACYLLNFCKFPPSSSKIQYAVQNLIFDVNMATRIGASGVVVHIGYQLELEREEAYQNMVDGIKKVIDKTPNGGTIILETPAGQGSQIATTLEDFAEMYNMFPAKYKKRLGICVDTCHVFSAGTNLHTVAGVKKYLKDFDKLIGKEHLVLFHVNDSKKPLNSRKDQHECIGYGYIYNKGMGGDISALCTLAQYARKNNVPMILETPSGKKAKDKSKGNYKDEIELLKMFASAKKLTKKKSQATFEKSSSKTEKATFEKSSGKKNKDDIKGWLIDAVVHIQENIEKFENVSWQDASVYTKDNKVVIWSIEEDEGPDMYFITTGTVGKKLNVQHIKLRAKEKSIENYIKINYPDFKRNKSLDKVVTDAWLSV